MSPIVVGDRVAYQHETEPSWEVLETTNAMPLSGDFDRQPVQMIRTENGWRPAYMFKVVGS